MRWIPPEYSKKKVKKAGELLIDPPQKGARQFRYLIRFFKLSHKILKPAAKLGTSQVFAEPSCLFS